MTDQEAFTLVLRDRGGAHYLLTPELLDAARAAADQLEDVAGYILTLPSLQSSNEITLEPITIVVQSPSPSRPDRPPGPPPREPLPR